jgi:hypothetical protein
MIEEIDDRIEDYSQVNHVQCFLHVVNLVAKSLLNQFEPRKMKTVPDGQETEVEKEIARLVDGLEAEAERSRVVAGDESDGDDDDSNGIMDAKDVVGEAEREQFHAIIRPVQLILAKVSKKKDQSVPFL